MAEKTKRQKGVSLFIAVLVASVATLFSFAISNIALREVLLAQTGRDSQLAFYAANSGIECALFWDLKHSAFRPEFSQRSIECNYNNVSFNMLGTIGGDETVWTHPDLGFFPLGVGDGCFKISITKVVKVEEENTTVDTTLVSRGYNVCDLDSPRILERAIRVMY